MFDLIIAFGQLPSMSIFFTFFVMGTLALIVKMILEVLK